MSVYPGRSFGFFFSVAFFALSCALAPSSGRASESGVGQVTLLVGMAQQTRYGVSKPIRRGDTISVGTKIETSANGHLHLRFIDGALVSLRPSSSLKVTEYQFNKDQPASSRVKFELEEGTARAITGAAGKAARENFRLNTPVAALGVRGTDFSVFSSRNESLVSVNSGAVVVSQFSDSCARGGFGPCSGAQSLELKAGVNNGVAAFVSAAAERPLALPEGSVKLVASTPLPQPALSTERVAAAVTPSVSSSGSAVVADSVASSTAGKALDDGSTVSLPSAGSAPSKLVWGRWYGAAWSNDATLAYLEAINGREVTVGNRYVSLHRIAESPFVLPDKGSARLALQSGQVHWIGALTQEPGQIESGSLTINFSDKRFSTELSGNHPRVGAFSVQASGVVTTSPLAPGVFVSDSSATGARVAGAVTSNATEAGYFFEQPASRSILMGTTNWRR